MRWSSAANSPASSRVRGGNPCLPWAPSCATSVARWTTARGAAATDRRAVSSYDETIAFVQGLEVARGWDLKLERMRAACALRRHPERRFTVVHVAGTNGKGSTVATIEAVLRAAGHRTGLYTSPHLIDFCERIRAGAGTIPREDVVDLVREQRTALDRAGLALTHFEFATLLAFEWFARVGVEIAVVEVGLGGRLDATNVVVPAITAITSIGLDHEEFLGDGIEAIAAEKAGIVKPGVPLVVGPVPAAAQAVIGACAARSGAPLRAAGPEHLEDDATGIRFERPGGSPWRTLPAGLPGTFQRGNLAVALTVLDALHGRFPCAEDAVRRGLSAVWWPGRLAKLREDPLVLVDGAHNPDGMRALCPELGTIAAGRRVVLVFAVMADKRWREMLATVRPFAERIVVTRVGRRGLEPASAVEMLAGTVAV